MLEDDRSTLAVETSDDGSWLVYSSSAPATLRQLEIRVVSGCLVLAQLAIGLEQELVTRQTELRVADGAAWLAVEGPGLSDPVGGVDPEKLLSREVLTVERFAKWIPLNDNLDGLAWAVARPNKGTLQERVLAPFPHGSNTTTSTTGVEKTVLATTHRHCRGLPQGTPAVHRFPKL